MSRPEDAAIRLEAARVLRPDGTLRPGVVVVEGARIVAVDETGPAESGRALLTDRILCPGFVDLQVNGHADLDVAAGSEADLAELDLRLAKAGTTSWCPTLTSRRLEWYAGWFAAHPDRVAGEIGIHLEGPFITRAGAHRPEVLGPPDLEWLAGLPDRVGLVTLAPELPGAAAAIHDLSRRCAVSLGHSEASYDDAADAATCGATLVTHVFNAMPGLHHRDPGLVGAALARTGGLVPMIIGDGVHVHPAMLKVVLAGGPAVIVTDSVAWMRAGLVVEGGAARLAGGTIAGSVITMADAVRTAVAAGVDLATALTDATATPARAVGRTDLGVVAPGARADLVELDLDLRVTAVWRGGQPVPTR